ncbi:hypothetical protein ACH4TP_38215 [Streptomyces sp. NPDC021012]|uniref:hypothetical protein n=1 Tax=Streptomyces sp. NPDC021012 TaxID=3365107 RepID=UPI0037A693A8
MTDTTSRPLITGPVQQYIEALLRQRRADEQARTERIEELEKAGHRIVGGGQTGRQEDGQATWDITDWRTGETILEGVGDYDAYGAAGRRLDPDGMWFHIDNIYNMDTPQVDPKGVPASLADALQDWLGWANTSDEDVAAVVGWSVEEVARHREED